jgi:hypothetical protein
MRQMLGVFAQREKTRLVKKLSGARDRKRAVTGRRTLKGGPKVEGRPTLADLFPEAVRLAKRLHRASPRTGSRLSLRQIAAELEKAGHSNTAKYRGSSAPRPFNPATIKAMIEGPMPEKINVHTGTD